MGSNKNLKAFVRYDGSGRVVAGSLILRKQKPKVGRWNEIQGYECCVPGTLLTFTPPDVSLTNVSLEISCGVNIVVSVATGSNSTTLESIVTILSTSQSSNFLGTFSVNGSAINLSMNPDIAMGLCPNGILSMTIFGA